MQKEIQKFSRLINNDSTLRNMLCLLLTCNWFDQNIKSLNNVKFWNQELEFEHVSTT
jgi:hypothetical protein